MADDAPKSAVELAMERLRRKDAQEGVTQAPLTEAQKAEIAEVRNFYDARLAEMETMHVSASSTAPSRAARAELDLAYHRQREQVASERDQKIARIRTGA